MTLEDDLARLERTVLGVRRVSGFLAAVDTLRRMLERETPGIRAYVLKLSAPAIGRDLAAAAAAAFDLGVSSTLFSTSATLPKPITLEVRAAERRISSQLAAAKKLARAGAADADVVTSVSAARLTLERATTSLVNRAGNAGVRAAAAKAPVVWVAETNACVTCLAYSGLVAQAGEAFPAGRTYGKRSSVTSPVDTPPAHPNCRCTLEILNAPEYAAALRREADRSVLRGFSLESESMATRIDAADRLLQRDPTAPKSVKAYARAAIRKGEFPTRGRP
jgi:hypothetical protein